VVDREEQYLESKFPDEYPAYMRRTPAFLPAWSLWRMPETLSLKPRFLLLTMRDSLGLFLAGPILEMINIAHADGWLPALTKIW